MATLKDQGSTGEKLSRRERNKARTRAAILNAARKGFGRAGIYATTMDEIAEGAEISRATLFNYFASKTEIVDEIVSLMDDAFMDAIAELCRTIPSIRERTIAVFDHGANGLDKLGRGAKHLVGYSELAIHEDTGAGRMARLRAAFSNMLGYGITDPHETLEHPVIESAVAIYVGIIHNWRITEDYDLHHHLRRACDLIFCLMDNE
ncbi:helix-turn-helix domain-containing protein [Sphingomonas sp. C3-2]|uniref:TetR/AcrR family transcriptional regulator n=1 Tax=Sphingomonas sp. C3-2 TaxID=3062169 RepID=UPI00294B11BE|nr:helix-turn-helix domain-containing protein [Sphingomonas sp. C3-2]WOK36524.1 helix-turn-helix domain-containing protein [Sphingomonas sp. C3-2]